MAAVRFARSSRGLASRHVRKLMGRGTSSFPLPATSGMPRVRRGTRVVARS